MIIMGIDPGTAITGYGIVEYDNNRFKAVAYDAIRTPAGQELPLRLQHIYREITDLIKKYRPETVAIEELFFNKNVRTALAVGQARGTAVVAAANSGVQVAEYTPLQVKQSVAGYGRAEKEQIQYMVRLILNLPEVPKPDDVADALAIAICHGNSCSLLNKLHDMQR